MYKKKKGVISIIEKPRNTNKNKYLKMPAGSSNDRLSAIL